MHEKEIVQKLLLIRNMAILRLQTCWKFCFKQENQEELIDHISAVEKEFKDVHFV